MFGNSALILKLAWANWQHMNARRIAWQARLLSATALRRRRSQIWSTGLGSGCLLCWIYQRKHRYAAWNIAFWQSVDVSSWNKPACANRIRAERVSYYKTSVKTCLNRTTFTRNTFLCICVTLFYCLLVLWIFLKACVSVCDRYSL